MVRILVVMLFAYVGSNHSRLYNSNQTDLITHVMEEQTIFTISGQPYLQWGVDENFQFLLQHVLTSASLDIIPPPHKTKSLL